MLERVLWRHHKTGGVYRIKAFAIQEATMEPVVVYVKVGDHDQFWVRPCSEFFDGRFVQERIDEVKI